MKTDVPLAQRFFFPILFCFFLTLPGTLLAQNILDKTGNPAATALVAFSVRQLSSTYTGKAMQVRRSSDSATQDIGFTSAGDLDTAALKTFVGDDTGYVTTWYDQSGNGYNATQTTASKQPIIMTSGTINKDNGRPSVYTDTTGFLSYGAISELNAGTQVTRMEVCRNRTGNFAITSGLGNFQLDLQLFPAQVMVQFGSPNITAAGSVGSTQALMAINAVRNSGASQVYVNTSLIGTSATSLSAFSASVTGYVGVRFDYYLGNGGPGAFSETILFNSVLTDADRQAINYNENWYYSLGFDPCSSTAASLPPNGKTTKALYACMQDGTWAYYYDPAHPLKLLFGIAKDPGNTGANPSFVADSINLTATSDPTIYMTAALSATDGLYTLGRYWNVYTHTPLTSPVNIRFFYNPADTLAAYNAALSYKNAFGLSWMSNLIWFKTVGFPYRTDSLTATPTATVKGKTITLTPVYGSKDGVNYAEFDGITSFSGGTGVYIFNNTMATMPLTLGAFTGRRVNETTALNWTTESESNSERFDVQRSTDGKSWVTIGQVAAAGNSSTPLSYHFTDTTSLHGENNLYYRLALVDKDGRSTYSGVVLIKLYDDTTAVPQVSRIVPNPFGGDIEITCTVPVSGTVEVLLQDIAGATLIRREFLVHKGDNVLKLTNLNGLARGTYIVQVVQGGSAGIGKAIKAQ